MRTIFTFARIDGAEVVHTSVRRTRSVGFSVKNFDETAVITEQTAYQLCHCSLTRAIGIWQSHHVIFLLRYLMVMLILCFRKNF